MLNQKSVSKVILLSCFAIVSTLVFISCSGGGDTKAADSDTAAAEPAAIAPATDSAAMEMDTTLLDSASTRPVKNPNKTP